MADPQNQDWFASNAPAPPPVQAGGDWFASNAPKAQPVPILAGYQRVGHILKEAGKDLAGAAGGMAEMFSGSPVTGPLKLGQAVTGRYMDAYQGAKDAANKGDTTESMFKSAAVPFAPLGADEIYDDAKAGNNDAALGKGLSRIAQVAAPEVAPHVLPETMPKISLPEGGDLAAKAKAVGRLLPREATGAIPVISKRFNALRAPTLAEYADAFKAKADPQLGLFKKTPKLGDSPLFSTADAPPAESTAAGPVPSGEPAATPQTVNSEAPRTNSGEGVLTQALTALDNKTLLKVARSRGIDVTKEAQLKPGSADATVIKKIIDDFSPDELDEVRNQGIEISRHKPVPPEGVSPEAGKEAWHYKVLNTFFPDVSITKAMAARAEATIAARPSGAAVEAKARFDAARSAAESKANAVPVDDLQGGHAGNGVSSVEELSRPGANYIVSKSGQLTYHGKSFAPETTPAGSSHVTVLPDGTLQVNAGPQLNASQQGALRFAVKKQPWLTKAAKAGD